MIFVSRVNMFAGKWVSCESFQVSSVIHKLAWERFKKKKKAKPKLPAMSMETHKPSSCSARTVIRG
jgi:hypothetical protein